MSFKFGINEIRNNSFEKFANVKGLCFTPVITHSPQHSMSIGKENDYF